jgi:hypothetical protein
MLMPCMHARLLAAGYVVRSYQLLFSVVEFTLWLARQLEQVLCARCLPVEVQLACNAGPLALQTKQGVVEYSLIYGVQHALDGVAGLELV